MKNRTPSWWWPLPVHHVYLPGQWLGVVDEAIEETIIIPILSQWHEHSIPFHPSSSYEQRAADSVHAIVPQSSTEGCQ